MINKYLLILPEVIPDSIMNRIKKLMLNKEIRWIFNKELICTENELELCSIMLKLFAIFKSLGINSHSVKILKTSQGKPYVQGYSGKFFNISHSGRVIICVTSDVEVGVDIQIVKKVNFKKIALRFFSLEERKQIEKSNDPLKEFFDIWTKKESFVKCIGTGISKGFRNNCYTGYQFEKFDLFEKYRVCICNRIPRILY